MMTQFTNNVIKKRLRQCFKTASFVLITHLDLEHLFGAHFLIKVVKLLRQTIYSNACKSRLYFLANIVEEKVSHME